MPSSLTVGTNTYVTLAEANAYLADQLRAWEDWEGLDDDTKIRALITAARIFEKQPWAGARTVEAQDMSFPRTGLTYRDGRAVDSATVPPEVEFAQIEYAYELTVKASLETTGGQGSDKRRVKAGSVEVEFFRATSGADGVGGTRFPPTVQELIGQFLGSGGIGTGGSYVSGTDTSATSTFSDCNSLDRTEPLA